MSNSEDVLSPYFRQPWKGRFGEVQKLVKEFVATHVAPNEARYFKERSANISAGRSWSVVPVIEELKKEAKSKQLWNLFLPSCSGLTQHEYAQLAEMMGRY